MKRKYDLLSIGTVYVDIDCLNFPFSTNLAANKETVGNQYELHAGGSALTFARTCSQLKIKPVFIGKTGKDKFSRVAHELAQESGIHLAIISSPTVSTNVAVHYLRHDGISIMTSVGTANQSITIDEVRELCKEYIPQVRYLYLGGAFKMKSLLAHYEELVTLAHAYDVQVILDHGRVNNGVKPEEIVTIRNLVKNIDLYLPSKDEFLQVWESDTVEDGLAHVHQISAARIAIKNSENGAIGLDGDKIMHVPAFPVKAINTVGAGDTFNAGLISALAGGKNMKESLTYACAAAALKISQQKVTKETIQDLLDTKIKKESL